MKLAEKKLYWRIHYVFHVHKMVTYSLIYNTDLVRQTQVEVNFFAK